MIILVVGKIRSPRRWARRLMGRKERSVVKVSKPFKVGL